MSSPKSDHGYSQSIPEPIPNIGAGSASKAVEPHPAGKIKFSKYVQLLRLSLLIAWFNCCCASIHITQWLGTPLYFCNRDYYYAYVALTKQMFGLLMITITQWFSPTVIRVSGHESVRGQLRQTKDGLLETDFPERMVMITNHQLYTEWTYLWWIAYTSKMHGHVYIILKESLKFIPFLGPGMMFFGFVFMARNWAKDKVRLAYRLQKLKTRHGGPLSGSQDLDPMWLIIFPEGTNLSANTRKRSAAWAAKQGIEDLRHTVLPRHTGLQFCLQELDGTVDWIYDCTIAYEGIPRGGYGQDYFTLRSTFLQGRPPKSVNMYWRRFPIASIPISNTNKFDIWLKQVWQEKDDLLEYFAQNGRFPADEGQDLQGGAATIKGAGFIETEVRLDYWYEIGQIFIVVLTLAMVSNVLAKAWNLWVYGDLIGAG